MAAVGTRFRAEVADRARSWLGLVLLISLAGGLVMAAAGAARRTDSAYSRFLGAEQAADASYADDGSSGLPPLDFAAVERLPEVVAAARGVSGYIDVGPGIAFLAPADGRYGSVIDRAKVLQGRLPRPDAADELAASFTVAERFGWTVGQSIPYPHNPADAEVAARNGFPQSFRLVGIVAAPAAFPPFTNGVPYLRATPAFYERYHAADGLSGTKADVLEVRLRHGAADLPAFQAGVRRIAHDSPLAAFDGRAELERDVHRSIHLQAEAVWLLAGFAALAALLVLAQALARHTRAEAADHPTLGALGFTRAQLWSLGMARLTILGAAAVGPAAVVALALSPVAPIGLARTAEPHPGVAVDATVLLLGAAAILLFPALVGAFPAWRAARVAKAEAGTPARPSRITAGLARAGLPPSAVAGSRMALEPGRSSGSAVHATVAGISLSIAALAAALTFGAGLNRLVSTPTLYGLRWDTYLTNYGSGPDWGPLAGPALSAHPEIEAYSVGTVAGPIEIGGRATGFVAIGEHRGTAFPPAVAGTLPDAPDQIALASRTMRELGTHPGESVEVAIAPDAPPITFRVVGRVVSPPFRTSRLGEGAVVTLAGMQRVVAQSGDIPESYGYATDALVRFAPGVDSAARSRVLASLETVLAPGGDENGASFSDVPIDPPNDILSFGGVKGMPYLLSGLVGLLAAGTLAYFLLSSTRRRRRDLALLKTVGFVRSQVMATVTWQATILVAISAALGLPVGVALGRGLWTAFANQTGVLPAPHVPVTALALVVPAAVVVANLVAAVPAWGAARMRPADVLRSE